MSGPYLPLDQHYNVEPDDDYLECYQSTSDLAMESLDAERMQIVPDVRETIVAFLRTAQLPPLDDALQLLFGRNAIGEFPQDRSIWFFLGEPRGIAPPLLHALQNEVLATFPLWRLVAQYEEKKLGIYPRYLWIDGTAIEGVLSPTEPAYVQWRKEADQVREAKYGPLRRQLRHLRQILPTAFDEVRNCRFKVLACFDRQSLTDTTPVAWVLHTLDRGFKVNSEFSAIHRYAVADRTVFPEFCDEFVPHTDRRPDFWLDAYLVSAGQTSLIATQKGKTIAASGVGPVMPDLAARSGSSAEEA
jgi:hypothetical protein